jgi:hypothetical protein
MCFKVSFLLFLGILHFSRSQLVFVEEKHFLADLLKIRKVLNNPPIIETIQDKDEKKELPQLKWEEAQPKIISDQSSKSKSPTIVFLGKVCFFPAL